MSDVDQLLHALDTLYNKSDKTEKDQAGHFLEQFQKSPAAWQVAHRILSDEVDKYPAQAKIFSAQTLRSKISYDLHQVPIEARLGLKNSIINLIKMNSVHRSTVISVQMSAALADLALQLLQWKDVMAEMVSEFGSSAATMPCLLEFLKVLPEELSDPKRSLLTDEEFRERADELLTSNAKQVIELLVNYLHSPESRNYHSLVFECLDSWLKEINMSDIMGTPLLDIMFEALSNPETFDPAVDCICSVIKETREVSESMDVISAMYPRIIGLRPRIAIGKDDPDAFRGYTTIFAEAGESWHMLIAEQPVAFRELVECVAECTSLDEDLEVVEYTFYFWYCLKQMIVMDLYAEARKVLDDIYLQLISVIIRHLHYPPGDSNKDLFHGDREAEEKFRSFRHKIGDVLKDCCAVVGSTRALQEAYQKLMTALQATLNGDSSVTWQDIEAPLFSMRAMAREVDLNEDEMLPNIMKSLVQLPEHDKIRYAATLVLGRYTEWTARHPEYLEFQLQYITNGFTTNSKDVTRAAAQALMHFCQDCKTLLAPYIEQLYTFYEKVYGELDLDSLYEVTDGLAHVVAAQAVDHILSALQHFGKPIADRLLAKAQLPGDEEPYMKIADEIELLTIFVRIVRPHVDPGSVNPVASFIIDLYPVMTTLLQSHGTSTYVAERISRFIKTSLHSSGLGLLPIVGAIAETLVSEFERTHYGCWLWVSGALVREFGDDVESTVDDNTKEAVWQFSHRQMVAFFKFFAGTTARTVSDLIEDFFRLMGDVLMFFPFKLIGSDVFLPSFQAAMNALSLEQVEPLIAALHYLQDLFAYGQEHPPTSVVKGPIPTEVRNCVLTLAHSHGKELSAHIVSGLIFSFPRDAVSDASALYLSLTKLVSAEQSLQWLSFTIDLLPSGTVGEEEKTKLLDRVSAAIGSGDYKRVRTLLRDFTSLYSRRHVTPRSQLVSIDGLQTNFMFQQ